MRLKPERLSPEMLAALAEERQAVAFAAFFDRVQHFANLKFVFDDGTARVFSLPDAVAREFGDQGAELVGAASGKCAAMRRWPNNAPPIDDEDWDRSGNHGRRIATSFEMHGTGDTVFLAFEVDFNIYCAFKAPLAVAAACFRDLRLCLVDRQDNLKAVAH